MLVKAGADVNARISTGETALFYTAGNRRRDLVEFLLQHGADVNATNKIGGTALMFAQQSYQRSIKRWVDVGADNEATNNGAANATTKALLTIKEDQAALVKLLVNNGASVDAHGVSGVTDLMLASTDGSIEVVRLLLDKGASVNAVLPSGATALFGAAQNGHAAIVSYWLIGADVKRYHVEWYHTTYCRGRESTQR